MIEPLRPIGTEFIVDFPRSQSSSDLHPHRITYRIIAHVLCEDERGRPFTGEQIEVVRIEEMPAPSVIVLEGK